MPSRFILHPLLENKRSRSLFYIFLGIAFVVGVVCWLQVGHTLREAGLARNVAVIQGHTWVSFFLSTYFHVAMVLSAGVVGAGLTARHVVGPVKRIEQWLSNWNDGINPFPLMVRKHDKFAYLVELLNKLYQKSHKTPDEQTPSS